MISGPMPSPGSSVMLYFLLAAAATTRRELRLMGKARMGRAPEERSARRLEAAGARAGAMHTGAAEAAMAIFYEAGLGVDDAQRGLAIGWQIAPA
jgi:hypothetical protein